MADYSPEELQKLYGSMVGKELEKLQAEDLNFNPRGNQGTEIDKLTASMIEGMIGGQKDNSYDKIILQDNDLKYIVDSLISNRVIVPYVAKFLDVQLAKMKSAVEKVMQEACARDDSNGSYGMKNISCLEWIHFKGFVKQVIKNQDADSAKSCEKLFFGKKHLRQIAIFYLFLVIGFNLFTEKPDCILFLVFLGL